MGYVIGALFFFRFWRRTGEPLFVYFGLAFLLLATSQALSVWAGQPSDENSWIYLLRLAGFMLLIVGIVAKNVRAGRKS
jgi:hypothetical protein